MKRTLVTFGVIALVLLAGCSALQPGTDTPDDEQMTKESAITNASQLHLNAQSVTVKSTTSQEISIQNETDTVETTTRQNTTTKYNFSEQSYHMKGTLYRQAGGAQAATFPMETYYVDGTLYRKSVTQNGTVWQSGAGDFRRDTLFNISSMTDSDTLEHFTFEDNSEEDGTYVYTADLTNESAFNALIESDQNRLSSDGYNLIVENAESFTLTIVVDSETEQLQKVSVQLDSTLTGEQVRQSDAFDFSENAELDNVEIGVSFESTKQYTNYNGGQTITVPEEVKNETTA